MRGHLTEVQRLRVVNARLKNENARLRERVGVLEARVAEQDKLIEDLRLQLSELQRIVFGKKKPPTPPAAGGGTDTGSSSRQPRDPESYRRPVPPEADVTSRQEYTITECPDCHTPLADIRTIVRYLEDILLPAQKTVERQHIQSGLCPNCHKRKQAIPIPAQSTTLGPNTTKAVLYATYVLRLSFQQTINWLKDCYNLTVSQGEIAHILQRSSRKLGLPYEQLKSRVRGSPGMHVDESTYAEQGGEGTVWVMTPTHSEEAVFVVGRNRGKGNVEELLAGFTGTRITDCYSAYDYLEGDHQACWSHPVRYARELAENANLPESLRPMCQEFYEQVRATYAEVRSLLATPFDVITRKKEYVRMRTVLEQLATLPPGTAPKKLLALKQRFADYSHEFLACILHPDIPPDNNKAERKLRHIVLKRKISFGTRSKQGSHTFSINASVLLSLWWTDRTNWFPRLSGLLGA